MSDQKNTDSELIRNMLKNAEEEAQSIRSEAEKSIAERRTALERRISEIRDAGRKRVQEEVAALEAKTEATIALLRKQARLRREDRIYRMVNQRAREELRALRGDPGYGAILRGWIVEAALGLGAAEAEVLCAAEDRDAVQAALPAASVELGDSHGQDVSLRMAEDAISGQGVVLRDSPPTVAYSNTVDDRMRRFDVRIRRIVYRTLIEDRHE